MDVSERSAGHPPDEQLQAYASGDRNEGVAAHLDVCVECVDYLEELDLPAQASFGAGKSYAYLEVLAELLAAPIDQDPIPGDVWQLEWDGLAMLATVLEPPGVDGRVEVAPVTVEDPEAERGVVVVEARRTQLGMDLFAWAGLPATVPLGVFAARLDRVDSDVVHEVATGGSTPVGSWTTALALVQVDTAVRELEAATWAPEAANVPAELLRETMKARGLRPSAVATATGIPVRDVREIANGRRAPTEEQAQAIAAYVGIDSEELSRAFRLPDALVQAIERPIHRAAIRARALRDGVTEGAARLALSQRVLLRPARTDRSLRDVATWSELLQAELDDD